MSVAAIRVQCDLCKQPLWDSPRRSSEKCIHVFHEKCFKLDTCPICFSANISQMAKEAAADAHLIKFHGVVRGFFQGLSDRMLHYAIEKKDLSVVSSLLNEKASPSARFEESSALYRACKNEAVSIVGVLLEQRADPEKDLGSSANEVIYGEGEQRKPIEAVLETGNVELARVMSRYVRFEDEPDQYGLTPILKSVRDRHEELALFLIEQGADIHRKDREGRLLSLDAAITGCLRVIQELERRGVDLNAQDKNGGMALHGAAMGENPELLSYLLARGASQFVNTVWVTMGTPLALAIKYSRLENVHLLIKAGADPTLPYDGESLLSLAKKQIAICRIVWINNENSQGELKAAEDIFDLLNQ